MRFDGTRCGNGSGDGVVYEVFDPSWWRLDRWFSWTFMHRKRTRGCLTILIDGRPKRVRCRATDESRIRAIPSVVFPSNPLH